jgi:dihydrofolate reductase
MIVRLGARSRAYRCMTELHLIYARARNGVIGRDGRMPWHLPEDMAHFKRTTLGCPVIMGRKTWESLPPVFRPLPGRRNIVITRQRGWQAPGAEVAHSLEQARALCQDAEQAWIMGGADIYRQALPLAQQVVVTEIDADFAGDAFAPELGDAWQVREAGPWQASGTGLPYRFVIYGRMQQSGGAA